MPGRPKFKCEEIRLGGESYDFYYRDIILCIRTLFGDPTFARRLIFAPERHYQDADHTTQIFSEMHTGKWWWSVQVHPNISSHSRLHTYTVPSNPLSYAAQVQQWYPLSYHRTRPNLHFSDPKAHIPSTCQLVTFPRIYVVNQLSVHKC